MAKKTDRSAHSLMVEALEREVAREERMREFVQERNALANLERAFAFLANHDLNAASAAAATIRHAVEALASHPLIGRRVEGEIHELVISYGKTGYVALYRFLPDQNLVRALAIRHQHELDYPA